MKAEEERGFSSARPSGNPKKNEAALIHRRRGQLQKRKFFVVIFGCIGPFLVYAALTAGGGSARLAFLRNFDPSLPFFSDAFAGGCAPRSTRASCMSMEKEGEGGFDGDDDNTAAARRPRPSPHRGKVIGSKTTAADLSEAYQTIKSDYHQVALYATGWKVLNKHRDGSDVSLLKHDSDPDCPYVRMRATMPGNVEDVWDFLRLENWDETMPKMDPFYEGIAVLETFQHGGMEMVLARKRTRRIVVFGKRDFAFVSVSDRPQSKDGTLVSGTVSVVSDRVPRTEGYVRAFQDSVAFYQPLEDDPITGRPRTNLTIVFRLDLNDSAEDGGQGGYVPMWMYIKTVGTTGMLSVQNMKSQLWRIVEEREEASKRVARERIVSCSGGKWLPSMFRKKSDC